MVPSGFRSKEIDPLKKFLAVCGDSLRSEYQPQGFGPREAAAREVAVIKEYLASYSDDAMKTATLILLSEFYSQLSKECHMNWDDTYSECVDDIVNSSAEKLLAIKI